MTVLPPRIPSLICHKGCRTMMKVMKIKKKLRVKKKKRRKRKRILMTILNLS